MDSAVTSSRVAVIMVSEVQWQVKTIRNVESAYFVVEQLIEILVYLARPSVERRGGRSK